MLINHVCVCVCVCVCVHTSAFILLPPRGSCLPSFESLQFSFFAADSHVHSLQFRSRSSTPDLYFQMPLDKSSGVSHGPSDSIFLNWVPNFLPNLSSSILPAAQVAPGSSPSLTLHVSSVRRSGQLYPWKYNIFPELDPFSPPPLLPFWSDRRSSVTRTSAGTSLAFLLQSLPHTVRFQQSNQRAAVRSQMRWCQTSSESTYSL